MKMKMKRNFDADLIPETVTHKVLENWLDDTLYHQKGKRKGQLKSKSTSDANRSALIWFCDSRKINIEEFKVESMAFLRGHKNQLAVLKEQGKIDAKEGKDVLTFEGYRSLSFIAVKSDSNFSAFGFSTCLEFDVSICYNRIFATFSFFLGW